jgi:DNA-binding HxlR family transcriptional regulator
MQKRLAKIFHCSTEFTLHVLGGKWKTVILCYLAQRPFRYAELRKLMPAVSDKILTERLHELVTAGLVTRKKIDGGRVEAYGLTPTGKSLGKLLGELYGWGESHAASFGVSVGQPLKALKAATAADVAARSTDSRGAVPRGRGRIRH